MNRRKLLSISSVGLASSMSGCISLDTTITYTYERDY